MNVEVMPDQVRELAQKSEVQALEETQRERSTVRATGDKFWFVTHLVLLAGCGAIYYLLLARVIPLPAARIEIAVRFIRGAALIIIVLAFSGAISVYAINRIENVSTRFTLKRIKRLLVFLLVLIIGVSVFFVNWYTGLISLGLVSVIVGLSVQTPMTSLIGWIYILVRQPYRVGDRIQIDDATGDVIDVGYIDTTLWEFGGKYISGDHPSGRIIKFPNSKVLNSMVYNYSWPLFPYIWNEIQFNIAYESDLEFVARTMRQIAEEELGWKRSCVTW
jgi:small-conductance mechanosensitive channel